MPARDACLLKYSPPGPRHRKRKTAAPSKNPTGRWWNAPIGRDSAPIRFVRTSGTSTSTSGNRWSLLYDPTDDLHARLSIRGAELEAAIGKLELEPGRHFAAVRRDIRAFIAESEAGRDVEALVEELLS